MDAPIANEAGMAGDALRVLDPLARRMTAARPWRGVDDPDLEARIAELPRPPAAPLTGRSGVSTHTIDRRSIVPRGY